MTTLTAIADKAARLIFYGLILVAPTCGGAMEKTLRAMESPDEIRFQGRIVLPAGGNDLDRTTLSLLASGDVRRVIETSTEKGQSRAAGFDAIYRRRG